jgi:hypothetical protein
VKQNMTEPAYKIDTLLDNPLAFLPEFSEASAQHSQPPLTSVEQLQPPPRRNELPNLALRNLLRGVSMGLPSGQDVSRAMGREPLMGDQLKVGKATNQDEFNNLPTLRSINCEFEGKAPLWYYILAEAQYEWSVHGGKTDTPVKLGAVGSRIVVETFVGLLLNDGHSVLRQAPAWKPEIGKKMGFDMADLIKYALKL